LGDQPIPAFQPDQEQLMRVGIALAILTLTACGGGGSSGGGPTGPGTPGTPGTPSTPAAPVATTSVTLQGSAFDPSNIVVGPGATVTFTNADGINHNVTFSGQAVAPIGDWSTGARTAVMPTAVGTYNFNCSLHPGMSGSVKVQ
jgi:plastocyanin